MEGTMRVGAASLIVAGLVAVLSGCSTGRYESDFPVIVVNRTANTIQVIANGNEIGQVATGQTASHVKASFLFQAEAIRLSCPPRAVAGTRRRIPGSSQPAAEV